MKLRRTVAAILASAALAATTIGGAGAATNLLTNGDLIPNTKGWTVVGHGSFLSAGGTHGVLTADEETKNQTSTYAIQCIPADRNQLYAFSGDVRIPHGQARDGEAYFVARFFAGDDCVGAVVGNTVSAKFSDPAGWQPVNMILQRNAATPRSLSISMNVKKYAGDSDWFAAPFSAHFRQLEVTGTSAVVCLAIAPDCGEKPGTKQPIGPVLPDSKPEEPETPEEPQVEPETPDTPDVPDTAPAPEAPSAGDQPAPQNPTGPDSSQDDGEDENPDADDAQGGNRGAGIDQPGPGASDDDDAGESDNDDGSGQQSSDGGNAGSEKPARKPAPQGNGNKPATPKPGVPATGGESAGGEPDDLGEGPALAAGAALEDDGVPMTVAAGGLVALALACLGLGVALRKMRRAQ